MVLSPREARLSLYGKDRACLLGEWVFCCLNQTDDCCVWDVELQSDGSFLVYAVEYIIEFIPQKSVWNESLP